MEPIVFPFTYLPEDLLIRVGSCFDRFSAYRVCRHDDVPHMSVWQQEGLLTLHAPAANDEDSIEKALREYQGWAELHGMEGATRLKAHMERVPYYGDSSPSRIRDEIRGGRGDTPVDPVFRARLFLRFAHEMDRCNDELERELMQIRTKEQALFEKLIGEGETELPRPTADPPPGATEEPGGFMTRERLAAWGALLLMKPIAAPLFVTTSRAVVESALDDCPQSERAISLGGIPDVSGGRASAGDFRAGLADAVQRWFRGEDAIQWPLQSDSAGISLTLYRVAGIPPHRFFARFASPDQGEIRTPSPTADNGDTLIGLVEAAR